MPPLSDRTLSDEFSLRGRWWFPGKKKYALPGELRFSVEEVMLNLDGIFKIPGHNFFTSLSCREFDGQPIFGLSTDGQLCTLWNTFLIKAGPEGSRFSATALIVGAQFRKDLELSIQGSLVSCTHLEEWANVPLLRSQTGDDAKHFEIKIPIESVEVLRVENANAFKSLSFVLGVETQFKRNELHSVVKSHFKFEFPGTVALSHADYFIRQVLGLLSLLVGEAVYLNKVRFIVPLPKARDGVVEYFSTQRGTTPHIRYAPEMCLPLQSLSSVEQRIFARWFDCEELLKPVYELLLGTFYGPTQYQRTTFLNLMQAIESFHRRVYGGHLVSAHDYETFCGELVRALPEESNPNLKKKLHRILKYGNEPTLKDRLRHLCSTLTPESVKGIFGDGKIAAFLQLLVDIRNYLTHYDETSKKQIIDDPVAFYNLNIRLRAFVTILVLKHLGLDEQKMVPAVTRNLRLAQ